MAELETQIAELQEELKKAKDQLSSSESWKRRAQQEAHEAKKQLSDMSAELEETQKQLSELCESEESRIHELRKISQDRDREWQSELDAVQKQHSMDSAALASAMNEIQKLKAQLERVSQSEASQAQYAESAHAEIQGLRLELSETLVLVEKLKDQLNDSRGYEAQALEEVSRARTQLEAVKNSEETLKSEYANAMEAYNSLLVELEQSKKRANSLEEIAESLQADLGVKENLSGNGENDTEIMKTELLNLKNEVDQLRTALDAAEIRYKDEYIQSTMQIRSAYELVEHAKSESCKREAELAARLKESRAEVEKLKSKLTEQENEFQSFSSENKELSLKLEEIKQPTELEVERENSKSVLEDLKASLVDKEAKLQSMKEENEMLRSEILEIETERSKAKDEALALAEAARAAENEALMKLGSLTEEADKSSRKAERVTEQLDATQASNSELEAELRRLKVQHDQWRKAAEAAAAMLSNGGNGKYVERTGSLDYHGIGRKLSSSPHYEDTDDESPKKKNGNMLKKIGVLLKKGQK